MAAAEGGLSPHDGQGKQPAQTASEVMVAAAVDTKGLAAAVRTAFRSRGIPRSPPPVIKVETTKD
eukprot:COSAG02_NODE_30755_length_546_cov_0.630872_2_plen_64_part_01